MDLHTIAEGLRALSDDKLKFLFDVMARDKPQIATLMIQSGTNALCDYGVVQRERLSEANVCLSFSVVPADRALRARQLRALLDCGIYKGAGIEADLQEELQKLLRDPDVQSYLVNHPLEYPELYRE